MPLLAFVLARAKEPSSYAGLAMLLAAGGVHVSTVDFDTIVNAAVALAGVVAIFVPEGKGGSERPRMLAPLLLLAGAAGFISACSSTSVAAGAEKAAATTASVVATANGDIAALQPLFQTVCAGGAWADAQFKAISSVGVLDAGVTTDEAKAFAALTSLCAAQPVDVATAVAAATALYKEIATATPVVTAAAPAQ